MLPAMIDLHEGELLARATSAAAAHRPGAVLSDLRRLQGGKSSLTFSALLSSPDGDSERVVLKVAPPGLSPVRNRDVLRQARALRAIAEVEGVRVPRVLFEDSGTPPLFAMSFVAGESYEPLTDAIARPPGPDVVRRRALAAARMLACMQSAEPEALGLADEPPMSIQDELERWARLFATCGPDLRGREHELLGLLAERLPDPVAPRVSHGDYRLANMQFAGARLAAIIDWEIWSVGDPRADLAWLLMHTDPVHRFVQERDAANRRAAEGMPDCRTLLSEYRDAIGRGPAATANRGRASEHDLPWFLAYAHYKCASTIAALAKHSRRRSAPEPALEIAVATLPRMIDRGTRLLLEGPSRREQRFA